ncbi:hypothetical protein DNTS_022119 [Danionella cerebrum]|uniref:Uncharacterized protein n=1 Tax=Danionella cerebrum TaxID=2873325 RepID=A0A553R0L1_9TELE|nr:hypothetical protein DNTS_022119 [Danionella translucida]
MERVSGAAFGSIPPPFSITRENSQRTKTITFLQLSNLTFHKTWSKNNSQPSCRQTAYSFQWTVVSSIMCTTLMVLSTIALLLRRMFLNRVKPSIPAFSELRSCSPHVCVVCKRPAVFLLTPEPPFRFISLCFSRQPEMNGTTEQTHENDRTASDKES